MADDHRGMSGELTERDIRALLVFRRVAEAGGLSAAERALGMERSTISRHVKALEERLGAPVCRRGPRGFELTEFGRATASVAAELADTLDRLSSRLDNRRGRVTGELRVGLADNCLSNPEARLPETLAMLCDRAPEVSLEVTIGAPDRLWAALRARRLDAIVAGEPVGPNRFSVMRLFTEEFRLYAGASSETPPPRIGSLRTAGYGLVVREREDSPASARALDLGLPRRVRASGLEAVATLIATGRFVGLLPTHYARTLAASYGLRQVAGADHLAQRTHFALIAEPERSRKPALALLRTLACEVHAPPATVP